MTAQMNWTLAAAGYSTTWEILKVTGYKTSGFGEVLYSSQMETWRAGVGFANTEAEESDTGYFATQAEAKAWVEARLSAVR